MANEEKYGVASSRHVHTQEHHEVSISLGDTNGTLKVTVGNKIFPKDETTYFLTLGQRESLLPQVLTLAQELLAEINARRARELKAREEIEHDDA